MDIFGYPAEWQALRELARRYELQLIEDAAQESIDVILELAEYKKEGTCNRLVVAGCLPERYREKILASLPEVDVFLGTGAYDQIVKAAGEPKFSNQCLLPDPDLIANREKDSPPGINFASFSLP